jgi:modification target Cys-rich repeat protein
MSGHDFAGSVVGCSARLAAKTRQTLPKLARALSAMQKAIQGIEKRVGVGGCGVSCAGTCARTCMCVVVDWDRLSVR